jgi:hypothetical protein
MPPRVVAVLTGQYARSGQHQWLSLTRPAGGAACGGVASSWAVPPPDHNDHIQRGGMELPGRGVAW